MICIDKHGKYYKDFNVVSSRLWGYSGLSFQRVTNVYGFVYRVESIFPDGSIKHRSTIKINPSIECNDPFRVALEAVINAIIK